MSGGADPSVPLDYTLLFQDGVRGELLPHIEGRPSFALSLRSMPDIVSGLLRPPSPVLVAIVTSSATFRRWAETLLAALGIATESTLWRDAREVAWKQGLGQAFVIGADAISARALREFPQVRRVSLLHPESVTKLRQLLGKAT